MAKKAEKDQNRKPDKQTPDERGDRPKDPNQLAKWVVDKATEEKGKVKKD